MAPCPWFPEAVRLLRAHPGFDVGVHFTLTSEWDNLKWGAVSDAATVVDENGYFFRTYRGNENYPDEMSFEESDWTAQDVETELRAQIERILKHIPWASHATTHMGGLRDEPRFQDVVDGLVAEYGLGVDLQAHGFERKLARLWRGKPGALVCTEDRNPAWPIWKCCPLVAGRL